MQTDTGKERSRASITGETVDYQPSDDASESAFSSASGLESVTVNDTQLSLASEILQEGNSTTQAEKPKRAKQPKKKKEHSFPRNVDETTTTPRLLIEDDREPLPAKSFADLQTRILSLDEIIGNRRKGIPAIIPVSKSTWYVGVKSGRYPKSFEVSEGRVAWKGSDVYAYLQQQGMV